MRKAVMKQLKGIESSDSSISDEEVDEEAKGENIQSIKQALKIESWVDKIENFLNGVLNMQIDWFLTAKNNLEIIVGLIARPHEYDSWVKWEPIP